MQTVDVATHAVDVGIRDASGDSRASQSAIGFCTCGTVASCCKAWSIVVRFHLCDCFRTIASDAELNARLADPNATIIKGLGNGITGQADGGRMPQAQRQWVIEQVRLADEGHASAFPADRSSVIIIGCLDGTTSEVTRKTLEELGYTTACNAGPWSRLERAKLKLEG
jgi:hypothetical protein